MMVAYQKFKRTPAFTGFTLFAAVLLLNIIIQGPASFFSVNNFSTLFSKNTPLILVAMAQSLLLITGVLDISVGIQLALVNVVAIMGHEAWGLPIIASWTLGLLAAVLASFICGVCTSVLGLPPMLSSYAMILIIRGVNVLIMKTPQGTVPKPIYSTYDSKILGFIPFSFFILAFVFCIWMYLKNTRFGKHIYAVGGNQRNAYAAGISPVSTRLKAFLMSGLIVGIAGLSLTAMMASGNPLLGEDYGIRSLSACIIGGLGFGGWGSMSSAVFGAGFLVLIQNAVYQFFTLLPKIIPGFQVTSFWQNLVSDTIIFLGLLMTIITAKGQQETLKQGVVKQFKRGEKIGK